MSRITQLLNVKTFKLSLLLYSATLHLRRPVLRAHWHSFEHGGVRWANHSVKKTHSTETELAGGHRTCHKRPQVSKECGSLNIIHSSQQKLKC